jgi:hypothetical protein
MIQNSDAKWTYHMSQRPKYRDNQVFFKDAFVESYSLSEPQDWGWGLSSPEVSRNSPQRVGVLGV